MWLRLDRIVFVSQTIILCFNRFYSTALFLLVFMSPETAVNKPWRELFARRHFQSRVVVVAIDEAHCITEW